MRVVRVIVGTVLVVIALPMLVTGGALWGAMQHRGTDGAFSAHVSELNTDGYAVVAPDLDGLLRREASFARAGQTSLKITGTGDQRLFIGIGPTADVRNYLDGQARAELTRARLARGPLPVDLKQIGADRAPDPNVAPPALTLPATEPFWMVVSHHAGGREVLNWSPSSMRGRNVSLVVMNASGTPQVSADLSAIVNPRWLNPTTWGLLILGTVLFVLGSAALVWPRRHRDIVYVVEPSQLPEISARLGVDSSRTPVSAALPDRRPATEPTRGRRRAGSARVVATHEPRTAHASRTVDLGTTPVTGRDAGPAFGVGGVPAAPWFARVGGGPPAANSVAPAGRKQARVLPEEDLETATRVLPTAEELAADSDVDGQPPVVMPDPVELSWPPSSPGRSTAAVGAVPALPADVPVETDDEELPSVGNHPDGLRVTLDPFEVTPRNDRSAGSDGQSELPAAGWSTADGIGSDWPGDVVAAGWPAEPEPVNGSRIGSSSA
jgi:hypothetical protein